MKQKPILHWMTKKKRRGWAGGMILKIVSKKSFDDSAANELFW